ncbi:MAG: tRNA-dihydrouridine synthase, partial [Deltaproteobacteria bacterium]|nr:tRNA-dihydrouridine synthase [Deltaproteobacteria bacterium]
MHIGNVKLDNITVLAPLAGITNLPMRLIAKEVGCGLVCSEMISSNGLVYQSQKTEKLLES